MLKFRTLIKLFSRRFSSLNHCFFVSRASTTKTRSVPHSHRFRLFFSFWLHKLSVMLWLPWASIFCFVSFFHSILFYSFQHARMLPFFLAFIFFFFWFVPISVFNGVVVVVMVMVVMMMVVVAVVVQVCTQCVEIKLIFFDVQNEFHPKSLYSFVFFFEFRHYFCISEFRSTLYFFFQLFPNGCRFFSILLLLNSVLFLFYFILGLFSIFGIAPFFSLLRQSTLALVVLHIISWVFGCFAFLTVGFFSFFVVVVVGKGQLANKSVRLKINCDKPHELRKTWNPCHTAPKRNRIRKIAEKQVHIRHKHNSHIHTNTSTNTTNNINSKRTIPKCCALIISKGKIIKNSH